MRKTSLLFLFLFAAISLLAQNLSNMGTDFWTGFGYHSRMKDNDNTSNGAYLSIYVAAGAKAATVRISLPGVADPSFPRTVNVPANTSVEVSNFPRGDVGNDEFNAANKPDCRLYFTGITKRGIHIESTNGAPVAVYEHTYGKDAAGATLMFPTNTWGASYNVLTIGGTTNSGISNSFFFVMAAEDNTLVDIMPTADIQDSSKASIFKNNGNIIKYPKGVPFTIKLNKGEVFNAMSTVVSNVAGDLTGTLVKSQDCVNKKIMVMAGNGRTFVNTNGCGVNSGSDNLLQQMLPRVAWGTKYLTTPTKTMEYGVYRICVQDPGTKVTVNGVAITAAPFNAVLQGNFYYQIETNAFLNIESDKPIMLVQYIITGGCKTSAVGNNGQGDPEMIILSPVQQAINNIAVFSAAKQDIIAAGGASYINVVIPKQGVASFKIDGKATVDTGNSSYTGTRYGSSAAVNLASAFVTHPADPNYMFARFKVTSGVSHSLSSDSGFNAIAYGLATGESYGYNAGTLIKDLTAVIYTTNPYATITGPTTCPGNAAKLEIALPYNRSDVTGFQWDASAIAAGVVSPNTMDNATEAASWVRSYTAGANTYNVYKAPVSYTFTQLGTYRLFVTVSGTFLSECGGKQVIPIDVEVVKDTVDFSILADGCGSTNVNFKDSSRATSGSVITGWTWDFGDASGSNVQNPPTHNYSSLGIFNITLSTINSLGCISDTSKKIDLSAGLLAGFTTSKDTICPSGQITFTDQSSSSGAAGNITQYNWTLKQLPNLPPAVKTGAVLTQTFYNPGQYEISYQVKTDVGCLSNIAKDTILVVPEPVPDFDLPAGFCAPGTAVFNNKTTIADTTINTVTYLWYFGDGSPKTTEVNGTHYYTQAPAGSPASYLVSLVATSKFGCTTTAKLKPFSDIYAPPLAKFIAPAGICPLTNGSFTDASTAGTGQTIATRAWDFGDAQTGTGASVQHAYSAAGTFAVKLTVTSDKGCKDDTVMNVVVNPLPVAKFSWTANTCVNNAVSFTDLSTGTGAIAKWSWKFGDNGTATIQNPQHTYASAGAKKVILEVETAGGCKSKPDTADLVVNPSPVADFSLPAGICVPGTTSFVNKTTISDGTIASVKYTWDYDDNGSTSTATNGSHIYTAAKAGGYNVRLTATSANGCVDDTVKNLADVFEPPVANFTISKAGICENETASFTDASIVKGNQQINNWDWVFGDTKTGTGQTINHTYAAKGTYSATLTVTTDKGCTSATSAPQTVTVNQLPKLVFGIQKGICLEAIARPLNTSTAASETTGQPGTFTYSGPGVEPDGAGGYRFNPAASGGANTNGYLLKALYQTTNGCKDSATSLLKVFPTPQAVWTNSNPVCEKNSISLSDASIAGYGKIISWQWNFGDGNSSNVQNVTHVYAKADSFNVSLQVATDSGCTSIITAQKLIVNPLPLVAINLPGALCLPNAQGSFKDASSIADGTENNFSYKWTFGDGGSSTLKDPVHTYASAVGAPFKVQLVVTSGKGCIDSLPQALTLNNLYPPPVPDFTTVPAEICLGDSILFSDHSNGVTSNINKWLWQFGDNAVDSISNSWHTYTSANNFNVMLTVTNAEGCSASISKQVKVYNYPKLNLIDEVWVKAGTSTALRPQVTGVNASSVSYLWTPATYLDRNDAQSPVSSPLADQVYVLTVTAGSGCAVSDTIAVNLLRSLRPPTAFSPNGDGINDVWNIPNLVNYSGASIEVFDRYGRIAWKSTGYSKPWDGTFNGKPLPTGVYYYIIDPKNGFERFAGSVTLIR